MMASLPPGLLLMLGGVLLPLVPKAARDAWSLLVPLVVLVQLFMLPQDAALHIEILGGYTLHLLSAQSYSQIFAMAFGIAALGGALFAYGKGRHKELTYAFIYAGAALGVVYSGDFVSLLLFWELMVIGSVLVLWSSGRKEAYAPGMRYAAMHLFGGVLMMVGVTLLVVGYDVTGLESFLVRTDAAEVVMRGQTVAWGSDGVALVVAVWCILLGILVNLAAPPFSAWLADSYPEASSSGSVFLSAFTTKSAVFVLLTLFPGNDMLLWVGMMMVFYGIIMAMLENDMRRILSYSIINQVGFMVTAIGIGGPFALAGAAAHAFCHIIYKGLLMMSAGAVMEQTGGKTKCTELGGLYHSMPITTVCAIVGALAISSFPMTSGFISKSIISEAAAQSHLFWVWVGLMAASAGVFLHAGIKYPWFVFFQRDSGMRPSDPNMAMRLAMIAFALLCIIPGFYPDMVYRMLPIENLQSQYEPNTIAHWVTQLQLLLFSGLAFFLLLPWLQRTKTISLDVDWFYRKPLLACGAYVMWVGDMLRLGVVTGWQWTQHFSVSVLKSVHAGNGVMARTATTGAIMFWVCLLLAVYLFVYYW